MSLFAGSHLLTKLNIRYPHHESSFVNSLATFFESQSFLDLIFICKRNIHVRAHKMILSSVSEFLKSVIMTNGQDVVYVSLPDVEDTKLQLLLNVFYGGNGKVNGQDLYLVKEIVELLRIDIPIAVIQDISANTKSSGRVSVGLNTDDPHSRFNRNTFQSDSNNMGNYYLQQGGMGGSMDMSMSHPQSGHAGPMSTYQTSHPYMQAFPQFPMSSSNQQPGFIKQEGYNTIKEESDDDVILIDTRAPTICLSDEGSPEKRYMRKNEEGNCTPGRLMTGPLMIDSSKRRGSKIFNEDQRNYMEEIYTNDKFPNSETYNKIAQEFGIPRKHIQSWFSHKREKDRKKGQTSCKPPKVEASPGERKKVRFTSSQVVVMEEIYKKSKFPLRDIVQKLAVDFNLPYPSVNRWFLHRRVVENKAQRESKIRENLATSGTKTLENVVSNESQSSESLPVMETEKNLEDLAVKETITIENLPSIEPTSSDNSVVKEIKSSENLAVKKVKSIENLPVKKVKSIENLSVREGRVLERMPEFTEDQHAMLDRIYERNGVPEPLMMEYFARQLNSTVPLLNKWFERKLKSDRKKPIIDLVNFNPVVRMARINASWTIPTNMVKPKSILEVLGKGEVPRVVLLKRHVKQLEIEFQTNNRPNNARICELAASLKLPSERVRKWFIKQRKKMSQIDNEESEGGTKLSPMKLKKKKLRGLDDWIVLKPQAAKGAPENVPNDTGNDASNESVSQAPTSSVKDRQKGFVGPRKQGLDQVLAETAAEFFSQRGPTKPGNREVAPSKIGLISENVDNSKSILETPETPKGIETLKKPRSVKRKLLEDMSDLSDTSPPSKKEKRSPIEEKAKRRFFSERQRKVLEDHYAKKMYPNHKEVEQLAEQLNLPFRSVNAWFGNRRRKDTKVPPEIMQPKANNMELKSNEIIQQDSTMEDDSSSRTKSDITNITHALSNRMMTPVEKKLHNNSEEMEIVPSTPQATVSTATSTIHENEQDMTPPKSEDPGNSEKTEKSSLTDSQNEQSEEVTESPNEKHSNSEEESRTSEEKTDIVESSNKTCADTVEPVSENSPVVQNNIDNNSSDSREITEKSQESDECETPEADHGETAEPGEGITESLESNDAIQVMVKTEDDEESENFSVAEKPENSTSIGVKEESNYELNQLQLNVLEEVYLKHGVPDALMMEALKDEINLPSTDILINWFKERELKTDVDPEPFKCTWKGCMEKFADVDLLSKHFDSHS